MTPPAPAPPVPLTAESIAAAIDLPVDSWAKRCHEVSLAIVTSGILGAPSRVARGFTHGVGAQHSWVVCAAPGSTALPDCYDPGALILDATLWSYDPAAPVLLWATASDRPHIPHGTGDIWAAGRPPVSTGAPIALDPPEAGWSTAARDFLSLVGRLDIRGWAVLANLPVGGWPAGEILAQIAEHPELRHHVPIDVLGMTTTVNPGGLYLPGAPS